MGGRNKSGPLSLLTTLHLLLVLVTPLESKSYNSSSIPTHLKDLILKGTSWFSKGDLASQGYPVFTQKVKKHGTLYCLDKGDTCTLRTKSRDTDLPLVLIDKGKDPKDPLEAHTFVVLMKFMGRPSKYTAHKAYIREIDGEKSLEWDVYNHKAALTSEHDLTFFTAFNPSLVSEWNKGSKVHVNQEDDSSQEELKGHNKRHRKGFKKNKKRFPPNGEDDLRSEEGHGGYHCPKGSGAKVFRNVCKCPKGTKLMFNKCVKKKKDGRLEKFKGSFKGKHKKCSPLHRNCEDLQEMDEDVEGQSSPTRGKGNSTSLTTNKCPPGSGAIVLHNHCICPSGTIFNKSLRKCALQLNGKSLNEDKSEEASFEASSSQSPSEDTTLTPLSTTTVTLSDETTADKSTSTQEPTTEIPIPYLSEDIPDTKTNTSTKSPLVLVKSSSSESDSMEESSEDSSTSPPPSIIRNRAQTSSTTEGTLESPKGTPGSTTSKSRLVRFVCPKESGAFLKGDRCFCPKQTVLKGRKCIGKKGSKSKGTSTTERTRTLSRPSLEAEALDSVDILIVNSVKKRRAEYSWKSSKESQVLPIVDQLIDTHKSKEMKKLREYLEVYSIGNDKESGHPLFQSTKVPYTGILDCKFVDKKLKEFNEPLREALVDYYLHTLRAQCYPHIRNSTLRLFKKDLVSLHKEKYSQVQLNLNAKLFTQKVLSGPEWSDVISAIYLSKYSESITEGKWTKRAEISSSLRILTAFVQKGLTLLEKKELRAHAVKLTRALLSTVGEWTRRTRKLSLILDLFCKACEKEKEVNEGDTTRLTLLTRYILKSPSSIINGNAISFKIFYENINK